jgi:hypothetical protein
MFEIGPRFWLFNAGFIWGTKLRRLDGEGGVGGSCGCCWCEVEVPLGRRRKDPKMDRCGATAGESFITGLAVVVVVVVAVAASILLLVVEEDESCCQCVVVACLIIFLCLMEALRAAP